MRISSRFGEVRSGGRLHKGLDMAVPRGTPIRATASGTTSFTGPNGGYGNLVIINHHNGYETAYAHLDQIWVRQGDRVSRDSKLGLSGATGNATGPHLHYEVRKHGVPVNPEPYLPYMSE